MFLTKLNKRIIKKTNFPNTKQINNKPVHFSNRIEQKKILKKVYFSKTKKNKKNR